MSAVASSPTNNSSSSSNMTSSASSSLLNSPPVVLPPSLLGGSPECPCIDISPVLYEVANCIVDEYDGDDAGTSIPTNTTNTSTRNGTYVDVPVSTLKSMLPRAALGVYVKLLGTVDNTYTCVPITYGSQECRQHQLGLHPECQASSSSSSVLSPYCYDYFCYVDPIQCKNSQELYGRTRNLQPFDVESGIYYSYTTCRSTDPDNADRLNYRISHTTTNRVISAVVPEVWYPVHYKLPQTQGRNNSNQNNEESILASINSISDLQLDPSSDVHADYMNDTIPWQGWMIDYINDVMAVSDIRGLKFTHRSGGSAVAIENSSPYDAAVYDVQMGISCLAVGLFWITTERLQMTTFTVPLTLDKIYVWTAHPMQNNAVENSIVESLIKLAQPFELNLWCTLILAWLLVSVLGMWFTTRSSEKSKWFHEVRDKQKFNDGTTIQYKMRVIGHVLLDSALSTWTNVCSQSVDYDVYSSMSRKILNFGFGLLILVFSATYTANLAAFLTIQSNNYNSYIDTIDGAIQANVALCGHIALKDELITKWPNANWIFGRSNHEDEFLTADDELMMAYDEPWFDMLQNYDNGYCSMLVTGKNTVLSDLIIMAEICNRNLIHTVLPEFEIPVAFPVCNDYAGSISYWIMEAKQNGVVFDTYQESGLPPQMCPFSLQEEIDDNDADDAQDELRPITVANFALPLLTLGICCLIATALQIKVQLDGSTQRQKRRRQNREQLRNDRGMGAHIINTSTRQDDGDIIHRQDNKILSNQQKARSVFMNERSSSQLTPIEDIIIGCRTNGNVDRKCCNSSESTLQTIRKIQNYQDELQMYQNNLLENMIRAQTDETDCSEK